jgi:hypothetical protein
MAAGANHRNRQAPATWGLDSPAMG